MANVKFFKGAIPGDYAKYVPGGIYFDETTHEIRVGSGTDVSADYKAFGSHVKDAVMKDSVLTISYTDGKADVVLDFSDVASASDVNVSFKALTDKIAALEAAKPVAGHDIRIGKKDESDTVADNAISVALEKDITVMGVTVGNITDKTTLKAGTSLSDILMQILVKEIDVNKANPTTAITVTGVSSNGTYEVGTAISATLAHTYTDGKFSGQTGYSYNVNAGCAEGETKYYRGSNVVTSPDAFTITEGTHSWKCTTAYGASTVTPKKNNGTNSAVNIAAGTATSGTFNINGRYKAYIGYSIETSGSAFNSTKIKALAAGNAWVNTSGSTTVGSAATSNGTSIVIACPVGYKLKSINNSLGVSIMENFVGISYNASTKQYVETDIPQVDYTNGGTTTKYKIYIYPITSGAEIAYKDVTIAKA